MTIESFNNVADPAATPIVPNGQGSSFTPDGTEDGNQLTAEQVAALQKRDTNAQDHIKTLETENEKFRTELVSLADKVDKLGDVDSIMEKLNQTGGNSIDEASLIEKARTSVMDSLTQERAAASEADNFNSVQTTLTAQFGDKTDETVKKACEDHGMSWESMVSLAKANPKAALALCKAETKIAPQASGPSSINSLGLHNQQAPAPDTNKANFSYATNMSEAQRVKQFMERMSAGAQ